MPHFVRHSATSLCTPIPVALRSPERVHGQALFISGCTHFAHRAQFVGKTGSGGGSQFRCTSIETRRRRADAANLRLLPCPDYISSGLSFSLARAVVPKIPALLLAVA